MIRVLILSFLLVASGARGMKKEEAVYLRPMLQPSASIPDCTLQTYRVRSKLDCVRRCFSLTSSTWLTYTTLAPDSGSCVCLSSCVISDTTTITSTTTPTAVYFKMCGSTLYNTTFGSAWLNKVCAGNDDCPAPNSECFQSSSTCLCIPGYYYSIKGNSCFPDCDPRNLLNAFVKYAGACLLGHDDRTLYNLTHQQCGVRCAADTRCLTFDMAPSDNICYLSSDTALTSSAFSWNCDGDTANHYQRMCS